MNICDFTFAFANVVRVSSSYGVQVEVQIRKEATNSDALSFQVEKCEVPESNGVVFKLVARMSALRNHGSHIKLKNALKSSELHVNIILPWK